MAISGKLPLADLQRHEDRGHTTAGSVTAGDLRQDADGDLRQAGRAPDNSGPGCRWLISSATKIEVTTAWQDAAG